MASKDVTSRSAGSIRFLLPLILIFLIAAGSAYGCPEHKATAAYRSKAINTRTVSLFAPTVITYRRPVSYRRCANIAYGARGARYIAVRGNGHSVGNRYVAVRNGDGLYKVRQTRYIAVRNADLDDAPRYVAVRRHPTFVDDDGTRYVAVRKYAPRVRYVAVRELDDDDQEYAALSRYRVRDTSPRYVAIRSTADDGFESRTKYVAVRNVDIDPVETTMPRHVVIKTDLLAGTREVIVPESSYNDSAYIAPPIDNVTATTDAVYTPAADSDGETIVATSDDVQEDPEAVSTTMVSYAPVYNDDSNDQAILDTGGVTYVAAGDIGDACLSPVASTEAVTYVPIEEADVAASDMESDITYIAVNDASPPIRNVSLVEENDVADADTTFVATDNDAMDTGAVSYIPVQDVEETNAETVSYVPAETVTYVPVENMDAGTVMYVQADSIGDAETTDNAADECATLVAASDAEPVNSADAATVPVSDEQIATSDLEDASVETDVSKDVDRDSYVDGESAESVVGSA
jgi:hypothetical protein